VGERKRGRWKNTVRMKGVGRERLRQQEEAFAVLVGGIADSKEEGNLLSAKYGGGKIEGSLMGGLKGANRPVV